jgi:hypothetical protein
LALSYRLEHYWNKTSTFCINLTAAVGQEELDEEEVSSNDTGSNFIVFWQLWLMLFYMSMLNLFSDWTCYSVAPISVLASQTFGNMEPTLLVTVFL